MIWSLQNFPAVSLSTTPDADTPNMICLLSSAGSGIVECNKLTPLHQCSLHCRQPSRRDGRRLRNHPLLLLFLATSHTLRMGICPKFKIHVVELHQVVDYFTTATAAPNSSKVYPHYDHQFKSLCAPPRVSAALQANSTWYYLTIDIRPNSVPRHQYDPGSSISPQ